jgi:dihydropyrimidinase
MTFAEMTCAHVYIVHLSCEEALTEAMRGAARGVNVSVETLIQFLLLDRTAAEKPNFEGAKAVMSPPLREKKNQDVLWNGLRQGFVSTLATDHAPFDFATQKMMGRDDFTKIPNGIPSLEDRINLYFTQGVKGGRIDLHRFVATASTNTARLFGLFPRKGTIQLGADADLVVYDPDYRGKISAATHQMTPLKASKSKVAPTSSRCEEKSRPATGNSPATSAAESSSRASQTISSPLTP